jgi:dethiobiotin synthetase
MIHWRGPVLVTGTDTGVGKTIVTAAIAAATTAAAHRVAVLKPAQTGDDDDAGTVSRLAAPATVTTLARYPNPLAPLAAARTAGLPPLSLDRVAQATAELAERHDLVLVEGAGGLLVPMGLQPATGRAPEQPWTVADLAVALGAPAVVVVRAGLGTLNHTALTIEALRRRGVPACVVIGSWPRKPDLVHHTNLTDLATLTDLAGTVPEGAGGLSPEEFRRAASGWFDGLRPFPDHPGSAVPGLHQVPTGTR